MDKPVEAIERMRQWVLPITWNEAREDVHTILAYLDSLPEWPKEATKEWFEDLARVCEKDTDKSRSRTFRALAAIAPVRKKRVVNLWRDLNGHLHEREVNREPEISWRPAARNVELED